MSVGDVGGTPRIEPMSGTSPTRRKRPGEPVKIDLDPPVGGDSGGDGNKNNGGGGEFSHWNWIVPLLLVLLLLAYGWSRGWK